MQATILSYRVYGLFFALLAKIIPADTRLQLLFFSFSFSFFVFFFSTYTCRAKCLPRTANRSLGAKVVLTVCAMLQRYDQQTLLLLLLWHDLYFNWSPARLLASSCGKHLYLYLFSGRSCVLCYNEVAIS